MKRSHCCAIAAVLLFVAGCQSKKEEQQTNTQTAAATPHALPTGEVTYTVPEGWLEHPPTSQMRKAEFRWPGANGNEDAELAVFFFPGTGGSVQANLDRWYGQFKQIDGSSTAQRARAEKVDANGLSVTVTHVTGTYLKSQSGMMMGGPVEEKPNYAMLAAIVETTNGPWFFKATGPETTISHWRPSFDAFVKSLRVQ
ncbi:MAG: hypothetical protein AAB354_03650 [candidate division KSB1 bacterium]